MTGKKLSSEMRPTLMNLARMAGVGRGRGRSRERGLVNREVESIVKFRGWLNNDIGMYALHRNLNCIQVYWDHHDRGLLIDFGQPISRKP